MTEFTGELGTISTELGAIELGMIPSAAGGALITRGEATSAGSVNLTVAHHITVSGGATSAGSATLQFLVLNLGSSGAAVSAGRVVFGVAYAIVPRGAAVASGSVRLSGPQHLISTGRSTTTGSARLSASVYLPTAATTEITGAVETVTTITPKIETTTTIIGVTETVTTIRAFMEGKEVSAAPIVADYGNAVTLLATVDNRTAGLVNPSTVTGTLYKDGGATSSITWTPDSTGRYHVTVTVNEGSRSRSIDWYAVFDGTVTNITRAVSRIMIPADPTNPSV